MTKFVVLHATEKYKYWTVPTVNVTDKNNTAFEKDSLCGANIFKHNVAAVAAAAFVFSDNSNTHICPYITAALEQYAI